jgi:hypothetical protein
MSGSVDVRLSAASGPGDVPALCAELAQQLRATAAQVVVCDTRALPADLASVELLARLALTARRGGARLQLRGGGGDLAPLLGLVGLDDVLEGPVASGPTCLRCPAGQRGGVG